MDLEISSQTVTNNSSSLKTHKPDNTNEEGIETGMWLWCGIMNQEGPG